MASATHTGSLEKGHRRIVHGNHCASDLKVSILVMPRRHVEGSALLEVITYAGGSEQGKQTYTSGKDSVLHSVDSRPQTDIILEAKKADIEFTVFVH